MNLEKYNVLNNQAQIMLKLNKLSISKFFKLLPRVLISLTPIEKLSFNITDITDK